MIRDRYYSKRSFADPKGPNFTLKNIGVICDAIDRVRGSGLLSRNSKESDATRECNRNLRLRKISTSLGADLDAMCVENWNYLLTDPNCQSRNI